MTENQLKQKIQTLTERIRVLEEENQTLSERAEDIMLIGLVAENFSLIHSPDDVIDRLLERIAILKNIPFCACCQVQGTNLVIQQHYMTRPLAIKTGQKIQLNPDVFLQMSMGIVILFREEIEEKVHHLPFSKKKLNPQYIALLPFESRLIKNGVLIFIDDKSIEDKLSQFPLLLQRVMDITVSKLDSLSLFRELNQLNNELDRHVEQRTKELRELNKELKAEVEIRKSTEKQLKEDQAILGTLNRAQSRFFTQEDHSLVLQGLLDDILKFDGSKLGFIAETKVLDEDQVEMSHYIMSSSERNIQDYDPDFSRILSPTALMGRAVLDGTPVISNNVKNEYNCERLSVNHPDITSFLGIPIKVKGDVVAFIGLGNNPKGYSEATISRLDPFLTVLGNFIRSFQLDEQRRQIERNLETEKTKLSEIFDSAPEAIILTSTDETIIQVNREFSRIFGYTWKEAVGHRLRDLIGKPNAEEQESLDQALKSHTRIHLEALRRKKDDTEIFVSMIWSPIQFSNGQINILCFIRDVTEQRLIQTTLYEIAEGSLAIEGEAFLHNTVTFLTNLLNVDYAFISDLSQVEDNLIQSITVSHRNEIIDNFSCRLSDTPCHKVLEDSFTVFPRDVALQFPNDAILSDLKIESYIGLLLVDSERNPLGILGVMCTRPAEKPDIIEQIMKIVSVRVTEELVRQIQKKEAEKMEAALRQSQKMESMGRLAGGVAHDFNNILASIMGYAEFLNSKLNDPDSAEGKAVEAMLRGTERASQLTKQLLGFARKTQFNPETVSVNSMIQEALKVSEKIFDKKIDIDVELNPECWNVFADRNQIDQVLTNLFINARDAMPQGGKLYIRNENVVLDESYIREIRDLKPGQYVKISVTDTGIGIPEDVLDQIFEPFFTTKGEGVGTGLGLSVAYGIMRAHHGQITCYSEPGEGTTFNLYLPVSNQEVTETVEDTHLEAGTERILVVEDEEDIREVIKMQLESLGYTVVLAENGNQAVDIYRESKGDFDLVLFDLVMPGMNGVETYEHLVNINPDVRCILMSGYSKDTRAAELFQSGKVGFLQKPFRLHELTQTIKHYIH